MRIAQNLYEDGIITYLRTDSTRLSNEAKNMASAFIIDNYGNEFLGLDSVKAKEGPNVQDAHEAIRPTDVNRTPSDMKGTLGRDQLRLYQLIWKRFVASCMSNAVYDTENVRIMASDKYLFTASASKIKFQGFMSVYNDEEEDKDDKNVISSSLSENSVLSPSDLDARQHFTQPAPHFTEATLVRTLEELGIGRPSTYAPTITTLLSRRYITKEGRNLFVTEMGNAVNRIMKDAFPSIVDLRFTANLESLLDGVEAGNVKWKTVIENFYPDLHEAVDKANKEIEKVKIADEETDVICEECGRHMVIKYGPHGKFLACPGFPECRNTKPYYESIGVACPKCGKDIVMRMSKKGRRYYGCLGFPDCDFMSWSKPSSVKCPKCSGMMVEKGQNLVCTNDDCKNIIPKPAENED